MLALAVVLVAGAGFIASDSSAAANGIVEFVDEDGNSKNVIGIEKKIDALISLDVSDKYESIEISYSAKLVDSKGTTQSNAVSPSTGSLGVGVKETLSVTAPKVAGTYTLVVSFTYTLNDDSVKHTVEKEQTLKVVEPVKLSVKLTNNSETDIKSLALDFYVDGKKVNDDYVNVSIKAGESATASYDYAAESLGNGSHKFKVVLSDSALPDGKITGLGEEHTFYVGQSNYGFLTAIMVVFFIIICIIAVVVYRRPVKNYGKPKARR